MLFWLKKALTLPFLPLYFTLFAGLSGVFLLWRGKRLKFARILITAAMLALFVFSNKEVALLLVSSLENSYTPIPEASRSSDLPTALQRCTAILVLGGGHADFTHMSRVSQLSTASLGRITEAVRLARLLPHATLIVSGNNGDRISHAQVMAEAAISLGIAPERIIRMDDTRDTEDEAHGVKQRIGQAPFALVTSAWHMPRAMSLCANIGLTPVPCPADFMIKPGTESRWNLLGWDIGSLECSTKAIHERVGLLWMRLRGLNTSPTSR